MGFIAIGRGAKALGQRRAREGGTGSFSTGVRKEKWRAKKMEKKGRAHQTKSSNVRKRRLHDGKSNQKGQGRT